jgi:hypothetical protein
MSKDMDVERPFGEGQLEREVGTDQRDIPHEFRGVSGACDLCLGGRLDERHMVWAQTAAKSRQRASAGEGVPRVHG